MSTTDVTEDEELLVLLYRYALAPLHFRHVRLEGGHDNVSIEIRWISQ